VTALTCAICGLPVTEQTSTYCSFCARLFHLSMRNDVTIDECGEVWLNDVHLGLEFACRDCLEGGEDDGGDTLGLRAAGDLLKVPAGEVEGWIAQGRLLPVTLEKPYRFRRADVEAIANFMRPGQGGAGA
jgi:hypothetical protein